MLRTPSSTLSELDRRRILMLESQLHHRGTLRAAEATVAYLASKPAIVDELEHKLEDTKQELLFVTLDKSGKEFSPTTRYRDYALSPERFHWETQSAASVTNKSGRRYLDSASGWRFYLFVRTDRGAAFCFLGPARYVSHEGDRPIAITWQLETPMPSVLFDRYATLRPV